ncbi:MAG: hypothetical protein CMG26_06615 [Candidatus Marinimicrobia bacterium]|nr:hypothetical protein [Candidatus Neomarinimicrobiota bacterium]
MNASQYDWSYIRSELNPNDLARIDNRILILHNSLIVEYDFNGNEVNRYDLKSMHNLNQVKSFEIDKNENIWIFDNDNSIIVLDKEYQFISDFTYLDIDKLNSCESVSINNSDHYLCSYLSQGSLGVLDFIYDFKGRPTYLDYYVVKQGIASDDIFIDLDVSEDKIFLTTINEVNFADLDSNLKLPSSWELKDSHVNCLSSIFLSDFFVFTNAQDNTIDIMNLNDSIIQNLPYSNSKFVKLFNIDASSLGLILNDEIVILEYDVTINQFNVTKTFPLDSSQYVKGIFFNNYIFCSILNQGLKIIPMIGEAVNVVLDTPSIDNYTSIKILEDNGFVAAGMISEQDNSYSSILHYKDGNYFNYIPENNINSYNTNDSFNAISIDYVVGNFSPSSIIEMENSNIIFSNSGLYPNSDRSGGVVEIDLDNQQIVNIFNSENTGVLGGLNGIYNPSWNSNYMVINQIIENNGILYIVNPYNELYGKIITYYNPNSQLWGGLNIDEQSYYLPQEITFDKNGQIWIGFDRENNLAGDELYSSGGVRYLNNNNQLVEPGNSNELVGGSNVDVLSLDICNYDNLDILWVLTGSGLQGYTISNNQLSAVSNLDYFIESQFSKGDRVKCDENSNVWVTTRHSGIRVILSETSYTEYWPSYIGFRQSNSGLLSDVVYDIDFNANTGEAYISTDLGISVLKTPFTQFHEPDRGKYDLSFSHNPFLVPKNEQVAISNFPIGSTVKVMDLSGRLVYEYKNNSFSEYLWDGKDFNGNYLSSGIYIVISSHFENKNGIGKIAIIREE